MMKTLPGSRCPRTASANLAESEDEAKGSKPSVAQQSGAKPSASAIYLAETY
jgi:hypothetical protein